MNLDTRKIFVFVRQDLPIEQQMVQAIHATFHASAGFGVDVEAEDDTFTGIPFVVLIGVPDSKALARVTTKLTANALLFDEFLDTDIDSKPSAIATYPLPPEQAAILASYRLALYSRSCFGRCLQWRSGSQCAHSSDPMFLTGQKELLPIKQRVGTTREVSGRSNSEGWID